MKKIMILGASEFQIPLVLQAQRMGIRSCVVDYCKSAPAVKYADDYLQCSLKDFQQIVDFANEYHPDGVTAGASDVAVPAAAEVSSALGLPGLSREVARTATNKHEMIRAFRRAGVPHPRFVRVDNVEGLGDLTNLDYPLISKPADMSSSKGIQIARTEKELFEAVRYSMNISDGKEVLVEEYMIGPEVSVEILVLGGCPAVLQVTDKLTSGAPNFVELGHSQPSGLPASDIEAIKDVARLAVRAIGLEEGFAHAEIIVTENGPKMVEVGARMGGDGIQQYLIGLSTGLNLQEIAIRLALGESVVIPDSYECAASAIRFLPSTPGRVVSVRGVGEAAEMEGVFLARAMCSPGDEFGNNADNSCRFGYVVARGDSPEQAIKHCEDALEKIEVDLERE